MKNSTCSYCAKVCPPPVVSDKIGFLDGFSWKIVGYSYLGFIIFSILYQVLQYCYLKKKKLESATAAAEVSSYDTAADFGRGDGSNHSTMVRGQGRPLVNQSELSGNTSRRLTNNSQSAHENY